MLIRRLEVQENPIRLRKGRRDSDAVEIIKAGTRLFHGTGGAHRGPLAARGVGRGLLDR